MKKKKKFYRMFFTTRKDFSFLLILISLTIFFLSFFIAFLKINYYMEAIIALIFVVLFLMTLLNNKIILEKYFIRVYFGIFVFKIKYKDIKELYISDNHCCSLASSYRKVGIKTSDYKGILLDTFVSPMNREDFIKEVNRLR